MDRKYFGTDGIRGSFGKEPMTPAFLYRTAKSAAEYFKSERTPLFIVGRDTRASGPELEAAFCQGVEAAGGQCLRIGVVPTAAVAVNTIKQGATAGVMISASHNPYLDNGIKFFNSEGFKLSDEAEICIEQLIDQHEAIALAYDEPLSFEADSAATRTYQDAIRASLPESFSLDEYHVFVDASHGAAFRTTPEFLKSLGAQVTSLHVEPNGNNINDCCGSQHPEKICAAIRESTDSSPEKSRRILGLAHDGDADRLIMIDENGVPLDGDELLAILGAGMLQAGTLKNNALVATVMSNLGLDACMQQHGGQVIRTDVGDRYVLEAMRNECLSLGGEQSGHMIFLDHLSTGDGLLSAVQALRFITDSGQPLSQLRKILKKFPQKLYSLKVQEKRPLKEMPEIESLIQEAEAKLGSTGRIFFRYSGTENLARLLIEAQDDSLIDPLAHSILTRLKALIG